MQHSLNLDVLLHVIRFSTRPVALATMSTCRFLRHEGAKVLLEDLKQVSIADANRLTAFLDFLQAEDPLRFRYVRGIRLRMRWSESVPTAISERLAVAFPKMSRLEVFAHQDFDAFLQSHSDLPSNFSSLTSLKHLSLSSIGLLGCSTLKTLHSTLTSVSLDFCTQISGGRHFWDSLTLDQRDKYHPLQLLAPSAATLEELTVRLHNATHVDLSSPNASYPTYPNLRRIRVEEDLILALHPYIAAAQKPDTLTIEIANDRFHVSDPEFAALEIASCRAYRNLRLAASGGTGLGALVLGEFRGSLADLYDAALTCRILRVVITEVPSVCPPDALAACLAYARPATLDVYYHGTPLVDAIEAITRALLADHAGDDLVQLRAELWLRPEESDWDSLDFGHIMTDLQAKVVRLAKLEDLTLIVHCSFSTYLVRDSSAQRTAVASHGFLRLVGTAPSELDLTLLERTLDQFDPEGFVMRLCAAMRSLTTVAILVENPGHQGWREGTFAPGTGVRYSETQS